MTVLASLNAFEIVGPIFAIWAVTVTALGITRENFPRAGAQTVGVGAVSVLLAAGSIGSAVAVGILESGDEGGEAAPAKAAAPAGGGGQTLGLSADPSGQLKFDKKSLRGKPGTVTIAMRNPAPVPHDIALEGKGLDQTGKVVKGGGTSTVRARLRPGKYTFYCSVDGHRQAGMSGTLTIR